MGPQQTLGALSESRRRLLEEMQQRGFGRFERLLVRNGDPVLDPLPPILTEVKFGGENGPRPERTLRDFQLKSQVIEMFQQFDELRDGMVAVLEFKHGLPFRMVIAEGGG
jgi:hypothetical protein